MSGRPYRLALILLAAALHTAAISRSLLPAQDGLKFLRIARDFQHRPWGDVIRGADQHPLYPALVALAEPAFATFLGHGPETWRIAAQAVAALASLALLVPLYGLTRDLFDERIAWLAVLINIVLPLPAAIGHDTLSDSLALCLALYSLWLGSISLRSNGWKAPLGCGIVAGLGFLARPEVVIVPAAVGLTWIWRGGVHQPRIALARLSALGLSFLVMVGTYALVKGEVSEKLALRQALGIGQRKPRPHRSRQMLPRGLDDPRWDFSPKEEADEPEIATASGIVTRLGLQWAECLCGFFAFFAVWGVARARFIRSLCLTTAGILRVDQRSSDRAAGVRLRTPEHKPEDQGPTPDPSHPDIGNSNASPSPGQEPEHDPSSSRWGSCLIGVYLTLFSLILARHAFKLGYLSDRHTLMLVIVSIPWAAAGTFVCSRGIAVKLRWSPRFARGAGAAAVLALVAAGAYLQSKPAHPSRWGHWAAGRWLAEHAGPGESILDTRGWAAFISGRPSYDYWHVRQALTDSRLSYVVVGTTELSAGSRRAETLRALLAYSAVAVAEFPERNDGHGEAGVRVYRYRRPESWEGIRR